MSFNSRVTSIAFLTLLAACSGGTGPYGGSSGGGNNNPPPPAGTVAATPSETFTPRTLNISAGGTATFAFGSLGHNVTFDGRTAATPADIGGVNSNVSIARSFATSGTYNYHCTIHPNMTGSIVVN
jgi:plastocyanin